MKAKISIVGLHVADMARALAFYRDSLGFPTHNYADGDDYVMLRLEGSWLSLSASDDPLIQRPAGAMAFSSVALSHNEPSRRWLPVRRRSRLRKMPPGVATRRPFFLLILTATSGISPGTPLPISLERPAAPVPGASRMSVGGTYSNHVVGVRSSAHDREDDMTDKLVVQLARAYHFAATRHVNQRRKGESAEPYMNHLTEVAELVAEATRGTDPEVIVAAVLHDAVEDTATTLEEVESVFGERVASLVAEVTDDKSLPKQTRKDLQVAHARHASRGAQIIKLADKTSNLRSLLTSPPAGWSDERRLEYIDWARKVVDGCRSADAHLAGQFDRAVAAIEDTIKQA
jgi:catechol 2,3-dioxygenase-like lactoylglutathione lyase family enzyme